MMHMHIYTTINILGSSEHRIYVLFLHVGMLINENTALKSPCADTISIKCILLVINSNYKIPFKVNITLKVPACLLSLTQSNVMVLASYCTDQKGKSRSFNHMMMMSLSLQITCQKQRI